MSTVKENNYEVGTALVIVRAFADEPVRLVEVGRSGRTVLVAAQQGHSGVGFPAESVYHYSDADYEVLRRAFELGDRAALQSQWERVNSYGTA
jgi:hypothetical protein